MLSKAIFPILFFLLLLSPGAFAQYLKISDNGRYFVKDTGEPFFWLGDTAWELVHRLDRKEIEQYLQNRADKGFTVIQAVVLCEAEGLTVPNREGCLPLVNLDPTKLNEKYFTLLDFTVRKAAELGLYMLILPTWGTYVNDQFNPAMAKFNIFTEANARTYGSKLGKRYRDSWNVVWALGGDRPAEGNLPVWEAMAKGLEEGTRKRQLISYHPMGQQSSSYWLHEKPWLSFNLIQTGHRRFSDNVYDYITKDYDLKPTKPVLNGEPAYEDMNQWFNTVNPRFDAYEVRKAAYWSVFAGACGHTYGNNNVWQMYTKDVKPMIKARTPWPEALEQPGATQMRHLRSLMESRPFLSRIPDQALSPNELPSFATDHIQITRDGTPGHKDATYIMLYVPIYRGFTVNTEVIPGPELAVWWYSPSTGESVSVGKVKNEGKYTVTEWSSHVKEGQPGPDWVVVVDDASKGYPPPGTKITK